MTVDQQSVSGEDIPEVKSGGDDSPEKSFGKGEVADSAWDLEASQPKSNRKVEKTILEVRPGRKLNEPTSDQAKKLEEELSQTIPDGSKTDEAKKKNRPRGGFKSAIKATGTQFAALMGMNEDSVYPTSSSSDDFLGRILNGKYGVKKLVKKDEFGIVYSGRDINEGRKVVLKTPYFNTDEIISTFKNYADNNLKLRHRNVVESLEYFQLDSGRPFLVTKLSIGITLEDLIKEVGKIESAREFMGIFNDIFNAVEYAHNNEVIHGHIKPSKIYLEEEDSEVVVKLSDFAIADYKRAVLNHLKKHYELHEMPYLSPEHIKNEEVTKASDIYNIGLTSYYVLSGVDAFRNETKDEFIKAHTSDAVKPDSLLELVPNLHCAEEMDRIILETLDPDQDWRIQNVEELKEELDTWLNTEPTVSPTSDSDISSEYEDSVVEIPDDSEMTPEEIHNLKNTMRSLVALKKKQVDQEGTVVMKFTDIAAKAGVRESPLKTMSRLIITYVGGTLFLLLVATYSILHWDDIKHFYFSQSKNLFAIMGKQQPVNEETTDDELPPVEGGPLPKIKKTGDGTGTAGNTTAAVQTGSKGSVSTKTFSRKRKFKYSESPSYMQFIPRHKGSKKEIIDPTKTDRFKNDKKYTQDGKIW